MQCFRLSVAGHCSTISHSPWILSISLFLHLKGRTTETGNKREKWSITWFSSQMAAKISIGPGETRSLWLGLLCGESDQVLGPSSANFPGVLIESQTAYLGLKSRLTWDAVGTDSSVTMVPNTCATTCFWKQPLHAHLALSPLWVGSPFPHVPDEDMQAQGAQRAC